MQLLELHLAKSVKKTHWDVLKVYETIVGFCMACSPLFNNQVQAQQQSVKGNYCKILESIWYSKVRIWHTTKSRNALFMIITVA